MVSVLRFRGAPNKVGGGLAILRDRLAPDLAFTLTRRRFGARGGMEAEKTTYTFGPYKIDRSEVFYSTPLSYAMVNLKPVLPGHVLICPRREVKRFVDLSADETRDLWLAAKEVGGRLERYHEASSLTFTIQDGPQAGQTVPHVHIHILPRKRGDFEKNDEIYDAIDEKEKELKEKLDLDKERKDRTSEEMAREAGEYRALFS
ncbi:bifunctional bis(5'-adenosyl)-triphosphatase/adenylylsulfatase FHIT [Phoenix dactylifera]|uniref:Bis(5'-adenosyl)-triphosphatase n=1 Tax=Phoenix dactylifera TaxID=42345 RepID=A0A8B7BYH6_PHODC|nr:bifunctional bis(5'-adenosyl)-triphosphatase/adenylylsulfatase FHIT [Phoenix dactylifera]